MIFKRQQLKEQPVIKAMTRVPTIGGVPYSYWATMLLVSTGGIVVLKSFLWFFGLALVLYVLGRLVARYDIFLTDM